MELSCPVSLGEVLDKVSILRIKSVRIKDPAKVAHVQLELQRLTSILGDLTPYETFLRDLTEHNNVLWDVEDFLRMKEKKGEYDKDFIASARKAYMTNDRRFAVKDAANKHFNSAIQEQKSYDEP